MKKLTFITATAAAFLTFSAMAETPMKETMVPEGGWTAETLTSYLEEKMATKDHHMMKLALVEERDGKLFVRLEAEDGSMAKEFTMEKDQMPMHGMKHGKKGGCGKGKMKGHHPGKGEMNGKGKMDKKAMMEEKMTKEAEAMEEKAAE